MTRTAKVLELAGLGMRILAEAPVRPRWAYYRLRAYAYRYVLSGSHDKRIGEYRQQSRSVHDAVAHVIGCSADAVAAVDDSELMSSILAEGKWVYSLGKYGDRDTASGGPIGVNFGPSPEFMLVANLVCRLVQPETVIETGVGRGFQTTSILDALDRNQKGHLWSIDLPSLYEGFAEQVGEVIPQRLRERWSLEFGPSAVVMPRLLKSMDRLDVTVHDAASNYDNQSTEYAIALAKMPPGGVLISNMVNSDAFIEATDKVECRWAIIDHNHPTKPSPLGVLCKVA